MAESQSIKRSAIERVVLTVSPHDGGWAVEQGGEYSDLSANREEASAAATKQARRLIDSGTPCQVVVAGEIGYFVRAGHQALSR
jgi:hypothetical protein